MAWLFFTIYWPGQDAYGQDTPYPIAYASGDIQTVLLHPQGLPAELPFISLDSGTLVFKFPDAELIDVRPKDNEGKND